VEVGFRVKNSVPNGQTVTLGVSITSGSDVGFSSNYTFTVGKKLTKISSQN
jgi:hypothetical protein